MISTPLLSSVVVKCTCERKQNVIELVITQSKLQKQGDLFKDASSEVHQPIFLLRSV